MNGLVLRRVFLASLRTRRLATLLSLLAIALGVALGLAVQLIHGVALDEFASGMRRLGGEADLRVLGPREGFDDALFAPLSARPEVALAMPVLDLEVQVPAAGAAGAADAADAANGDDAPRLRIVALDVLQAARITPALAPRLADEAGTADERNALRLLGDDALFLSAAAQTRFGVAAGDVLTVQAGGQRTTLVVRGGVPGAASGEVLGVMDIAVAQQAFARIGRLSRIDLRLRDGMALNVAQPALAAALPAGLVAITPAAEAGQNQALSRAYRVNLTMLAAMALLTGAFLVFSTQWLAVVRRRGMFAVLRALGLDAAALRRALLIEGGVLGLVGGVLGVLLAYALSALLLRYVGADLGGGYFAGVVPALRLAPGVSALYLVLGVVAGVAGAWWPAREAAAMAVARGLRSGDEMSAWAAWPVSLRGSALAAAVAALLCLLPAWAGVAAGGYAAVLMLLIAAVAALPWLVARFERLPVPPHSALPRLARARLAAMPGQAVVAGAGVVASVALAVSMAVMVASFRDSVDHWLGRVLPADVYVRSSGAGAFLDPATPAALATVPGVARAEAIRFDSVRLDDRRYPQTLIAREVDDGRSLPLVREAPPAAAGAPPPVWISEALADLFALEVGATVQVPLAGVAVPLRVAGVWRDYARQHGALIIELDLYRRLTGDMRISNVGLYLADGADADAVVNAAAGRFDAGTAEIVATGAIRQHTLAIFDRTFLVTYFMEAAAVLIGLFGVATTFAALATSRRTEFGMLRHLGVEPRQIGRLLALEGALTTAAGLLAGVLAGLAMAWVLIAVVNRQSFHWSMDVRVPWGAIALFGLAMLTAAAGTARLAARQAMRQSAVQAVREDW